MFQAQNSYQWKRWWFNGNAIRLWLQPSLKDVLEFVFWDQTKRPKHTISYKINGECDKYCWEEKKNRIEGKKNVYSKQLNESEQTCDLMIITLNYRLLGAHVCDIPSILLHLHEFQF